MADGNCLFSAVMLASGTRLKALTSVATVAGLRKRLGAVMRDLAMAGQPESKFRRDWLASCLYDIDERSLRELCEPVLVALQATSTMEDMELLLTPLRLFVERWAAMVGNSHWGGLLTAELSVLATITGSAIEVLRTADQAEIIGEHNIRICDIRKGHTISTFTRSGLYLPVQAVLPSPENGFLPCAVNEDTNNGWVGQYPVLRVVLQGRHYDACTCKHSYPIPPADGTSRLPASRWFGYLDTLTEPYSSLGEEEQTAWRKVSLMIEEWSDACKNCDSLASYVNTTQYQSNGLSLTLSDLSRLRIPPSDMDLSRHYLLSDDIVTCYMDMLSTRAELIAENAHKQGKQAPPRTKYFDSFLFQSATRGFQGPAAKKKRTDLSGYAQVIIPALVNAHWLLAVCYIEQKYIGIYDPLGEARKDVFEVVQYWASVKFPQSGNGVWTFLHIKESRNCVQKGVVDCGIYICKAAESLGLGIPLRISQGDIPYVRQRMLVEFIRHEATTIQWPRP